MNHLTQVGAETINSRRVPVYALPNRPGRYIATQDPQTGKTGLVSAEGAKLFKQGDYPLRPELQAVVSEEVYGGTPFVARSPREQDAVSRKLLKGMMDRLLASKLDLAQAA